MKIPTPDLTHLTADDYDQVSGQLCPVLFKHLQHILRCTNQRRTVSLCWMLLNLNWSFFKDWLVETNGVLPEVELRPLLYVLKWAAGLES